MFFELRNPFRPSFAASAGKGDNPIDERYVFFGYTLGCPPSHLLATTSSRSIGDVLEVMSFPFNYLEGEQLKQIYLTVLVILTVS